MPPLSVPTIALSDDLEVSGLITGLWQVADMEREGNTLLAQDAARAMAPYVEAGCTTFDMADHYGSAEEIAGAFEATNPGKAQFLTKWVPTPGPVNKDTVVAAVNLARSRLGTEQIDLLQFHAWDYADPSWLDALFFLDELRQDGFIRQLGMTNCDAAHLHLLLASGIPIVSNQVSHSVLDRRALGDLANVCAAHDVKLLVYGTLAGGFLSDRWVGAQEPEQSEALTWSQMKYKRFIDVAGGWDRFQTLLRGLADLAQGLGVPIATVAMRYAYQHPAAAGVIVGARLGASAHLEANLRMFEIELRPSDIEAIDELASILDPIPGDCGDEYRRPPFLTAAGDLSHHIEGDMPTPYYAEKEADRTLVKTGTIWEDLAGFSRAVKRGDRVLVSGTTATHGDRVMGGNDPAAQTEFIIDKIEGSLKSVGANLADVVRTRIYVRHENDWEPVSRVHGRRFNGIFPANTLVRADPIGEEYVVEMEAEAILPGG